MKPEGECFPDNGPLMGLDISKRRIGVAVCDEDRLLVTPLLVIRRSGWQADLLRLHRIAVERRIVALVVGYPLNLDGTAGPAAQSRRDLARKLSEELVLPCMLQDESLTTDAVRNARREGALPKPKAGEDDDHHAAAVILMDALSALSRAALSRRCR